MQPLGVRDPRGSGSFVFIRTKLPEYHHNMKNIVLVVVLAVASLSLGACKTKKCCPTSSCASSASCSK